MLSLGFQRLAVISKIFLAIVILLHADGVIGNVHKTESLSIRPRNTPTTRPKSTQQTATANAILPTSLYMDKVNPPYACPFTNEGAFVAGPGTPCFFFTTTDGIYGVPVSAFRADPTVIFLPFVPCATDPVNTYYVPQDFGYCLLVYIFGATSVSLSGLESGCEPYSQTLPALCSYPVKFTFQFGVVTDVFTDITGFVDVPTFVTTTNFFSATVSFSSTRTFSLTSAITTTNTVTVQSLTTTTTSVTSTITFSQDTFEDLTESTTTTTYVVSTSSSLSLSTFSVTTIRTLTSTIPQTSCLGGFSGKQKGLHIMPTPYLFRQERIEQVQCPIPFAGSVYNSNIGSSVSTICNVAGASQLLTSEAVYNTWLWSMIKTYTPCAYASTDTVFWIGSTTNTCYALESTTTTTRPCNEIHPVVCINLTGREPDPNQSTFEVLTTITNIITTATTIITRTSSITVTANRSTISSVIITIPTFTTTTRTSTRNSQVTTTSTVSTTATGYSLTSTTATITETIDTTTFTSSIVVFTRTVTQESTSTFTSTQLTRTTITEIVNSCPVTRTQTMTLSSTFTTVITNLIPVYHTTVVTTDSQCFVPDTTTWATSGCGCANAPA